MFYQWLYSCFGGDKRPSIRLSAAGLCHFLLGKLPRKKRNLSQEKFPEIIHTVRASRRSLLLVSTLGQCRHGEKWLGGSDGNQQSQQLTLHGQSGI